MWPRGVTIVPDPTLACRWVPRGTTTRTDAPRARTSPGSRPPVRAIAVGAETGAFAPAGLGTTAAPATGLEVGTPCAAVVVEPGAAVGRAPGVARPSETT